MVKPVLPDTREGFAFGWSCPKAVCPHLIPHTPRTLEGHSPILFHYVTITST